MSNNHSEIDKPQVKQQETKDLDLTSLSSAVIPSKTMATSSSVSLSIRNTEHLQETERAGEGREE